MGIATQIEILDPRASEEKPLARITVSGTVTPEQIKKELRIGLVIKVDTGEKKKRKTFTVKLADEELKKKLEEYVNSLKIRLVEIESEERVVGELKLSDIRSE